MDKDTIMILIAILGCFVGLGGWLSGRDKKLMGDAEWRGQINAKLDIVVLQGESIEKIGAKVDAIGERVTRVESSSKQAHRRLDELCGAKKTEGN